MDRNLLKEDRTHGDALFPLGVYSIGQQDGDIVLDCHWHDELEFLVMTEGRALFRVDALQYEVGKGQGIFVNSGELHAAFALDGCPRGFKAVVFDPCFLNSGSFDILQSRYIEPVTGGQLAIPRHIRGDSEGERQILSKLSEIADLVAERPYTYELQVKALLYQIFSGLIAGTDPASAGSTVTADQYRAERIKNALKLIHENYGRKISTRDLSLALNLSEGHFCRMFKQFAKKTPIEYLNYYRVNKAARMLEKSDIKIIDAALEVGFDNLSYFISAFRRHMGTTPARYRALNRRTDAGKA